MSAAQETARFDWAIAGGDPRCAEPGSGAAVDGARRVVRTSAAPPGTAERLGSREGEPLARELGPWLAELARGTQRVFLCGLDPRPHTAVLLEGVAAGRFQLAGALHRALGTALPHRGLEPQYRCNPAAYFDDTIHTDEWQREVYDLARELAQRNGWSRIADLGCGSGYKLVHWFPEPRYRTVGVDLPQTVRFLADKYPERSWVALDLERQDMLVLRADLIIAADVIEHLTDPDLLLRFLARCDAQAIVLSTPDAAALVARGEREPLGPPTNRHHVREWTLAQFSRYVASELEVVQQELYAPNATQLLVCRPPETRPAAPGAAARAPAAASPAQPYLRLPPELACRERSRTRELERELRAAAGEWVSVLVCADLEPERAGSPDELTVYAPPGPAQWNPVDGLLGARCPRRALLDALATERGPHGPERALLRLLSRADGSALRVQRSALELDPAAQLAQLDALFALYARGGGWPDPRPLLGPAVRRAMQRAREHHPALAEDLAGFWAAQLGQPLALRPRCAEPVGAPSDPELAIPLEPGSGALWVDPERAGSLEPALAHAASDSKRPLNLLLPWAAALTIDAFAQRVLACLQAARLDPQTIAPLVILERPLFGAELCWIRERFPVSC